MKRAHLYFRATWYARCQFVQHGREAGEIVQTIFAQFVLEQLMPGVTVWPQDLYSRVMNAYKQLFLERGCFGPNSKSGEVAMFDSNSVRIANRKHYPIGHHGVAYIQVPEQVPGPVPDPEAQLTTVPEPVPRT